MKDFSPLDITAAAVGFPARVGVITRMDGTVIRFAESDEPITIDGDTFPVVPNLRVSAVKHTSNGETPSCQMTGVYGVGAVLGSDDLDVGRFDGASVQIYIVDRMNTSRKGLHFTGAISDIACDPIQRNVRIDVKGPAASARRLLTEKRSPMCRTDLYSVLCGVNPDDYDVSTTVTSIATAFSFRVSGVTEPDGWFNQGVMLTGDGTATEISDWVQSTQTITTYLPSNRLVEVGTTLTLWPGCDKTLGPNGCGRYFNALNFQGEPHFEGTAAAAQQV